jgi:hypothetical protein
MKQPMDVLRSAAYPCIYIRINEAFDRICLEVMANVASSDVLDEGFHNREGFKDAEGWTVLLCCNLIAIILFHHLLTLAESKCLGRLHARRMDPSSLGYELVSMLSEN